ncbi:MAG: hypothetical protein V4661_15845 [Pseudomonadota bacterium]
MNAESKVRAASNTAIWDALSKTDPAHTKGFKRSGGFSGTAIKPIWIVKRLTEQFGPCGVGWGMGQPVFQVVPAGDETMVYCTVECWHNNGGEGVATLYGVGGDKVTAKRKEGSGFNDDEAFKKAFTDAVGNAFKFIGVAADIHMGQFDDSKYVAEVAAEFEETKREPVPGITKIKERLGKMLTEGNSLTDADAFSALVKANKDDLKTIRDANHGWWTGDGEDFEGYEAWIARRRAELAPVEVSEQFTMLMDTLEKCGSKADLDEWFRINSVFVETLDGEEGRKVEARYEALETALKALTSLAAG